MDSGTTINMFGKTNMITNRQKSEILMNFLTNAVSKIVDKLGEIPGLRQKKFYPEMIENVLSLNYTTKKYIVTSDSGDENAFKVNIGDMIVKFPDNDDRIYLSKPDEGF